MVDKTQTPLYAERDNGFYGVDNPGGQYGTEEADSNPTDGSFWASNPNQQLGFEVVAFTEEENFSFAPEYYPKDFTAMKKTEFDRYGGNCGGETVSIKAVKNRELHAKGLMTTNGLAIFNHLMDHSGKVDLISPIIPGGGMECRIKRIERGNDAGVDPVTASRLFEYSIDFISTGKDEAFDGNNGIVTSISGENLETGTQAAEAESGPQVSGDPARDITIMQILEEAGLGDEWSEGDSQLRALRGFKNQNYWIAGSSGDEISGAVLGLTEEQGNKIVEATAVVARKAREGTDYPLDSQTRFVPEE